VGRGLTAQLKAFPSFVFYLSPMRVHLLEPDTMTAVEQRRHVRRRTFKAAQIAFGESAPILECVTYDLSACGVRLRLSTTYGIPHEFDLIIDGNRRPARSVWRTPGEIGVVFPATSQRGADFGRRGQDIAPLLALLKMASERWPVSGNENISESELLERDRILLELWPEACRRTGVPVHEFPMGVIRLWQQKMGWPN
jgi:hypothetical protein